MAQGVAYSGSRGLISAKVGVGTELILMANRWQCREDRDSSRFAIFGTDVTFGYDTTDLAVASGVVMGGARLKGTCSGVLDADTNWSTGSSANSIASETITFVLTESSSDTTHKITALGCFTSWRLRVKAGEVPTWEGSFEATSTGTTWGP